MTAHSPHRLLTCSLLLLSLALLTLTLVDAAESQPQRPPPGSHPERPQRPGQDRPNRPIPNAPHARPEGRIDPTRQRPVHESAPIRPAGNVEGSDIEGLRNHPHVRFQDQDPDTSLPELVDQSCYESYCNNPDVPEFAKKLCLVLVLHPSHQDERKQHEAKKAIRALALKQGNKQHQFVWIDGDRQKNFLEAFHIFPSPRPQLVLLNSPKRSFIPYSANLATVELERFLSAVYENRMHWLPIPGPVVSGVVTLSTDSVTCPRAEKPFVNDDGLSGDSAIDELNKAPSTVRDEGQMIFLTSKNFDAYVTSSKQPWFLLFCNKLEAACNPYLGKYLNAAKILRNQVRFGYIDTTTQTDLAQLYEVHSVPAVKYFDQFSASKTVSTVKDFIGNKEGPGAEQALITHANGLLDASLVRQVFTSSFSEWMRSAGREATVYGLPTPTDSFVIRVLLFQSSLDVPTYLQALSYKWRHLFYFGVTLASENALLRRFGVTKIPSIAFAKVPRDLTLSQQREVDFVDFQATEYDGILTFNHLDKYCEELLQTLREQEQEATTASTSSTNPSSATPSRNQPHTHDEL